MALLKVLMITSKRERVKLVLIICHLAAVLGLFYPKMWLWPYTWVNALGINPHIVQGLFNGRLGQ